MTAQFLEGLRQMGPVVWVLGLVSVTLPGFIGMGVLFGSATKAQRIQQFIEQFGSAAPWVAIALFALTTGSSVAPTYAMSFACGAIFGSFGLGGTVAVSGVVLGAMVGYFWGALLARKRVMEVVSRHEKARIIREALLDRPLFTEAWVIALVRFPPNSPFSLTNLVMSSLRVRVPAFFMGTLVGMMPRTLFATWVGVQVGDLSKAQTADAGTRAIIGGVIGIVVFLIVYRIMSRWAKQALRDHAGVGGSTPPASVS